MLNGYIRYKNKSLLFSRKHKKPIVPGIFFSVKQNFLRRISVILFVHSVFAGSRSPPSFIKFFNLNNIINLVVHLNKCISSRVLCQHNNFLWIYFHVYTTKFYLFIWNKYTINYHCFIARSANNNNAPTNFTKGSLIELSNGELRPVEEMRIDDFIMSSNKNPDLQLADTTVVNIINGQQNSVIITFSYNDHKVCTFNISNSFEYFIMFNCLIKVIVFIPIIFYAWIASFSSIKYPYDCIIGCA